MALKSFTGELLKAQANGYAIPLYNVFELQGIDGIFSAAEACHAPTIIAIYSNQLHLPLSRALVEYIKMRAVESTGVFTLMLDHGPNVETCLLALQMGFTDVMFDGSSLPFEENVAKTRQIVEAAHARGVGVEAELGHVGLGEDYDTISSQRYGFTDPDEAVRFVEATGIDSLAIAFGNAHGNYKGEPHLDIELLKEIRGRVSIPLVLHGGSGISTEQFHQAIDVGIAKINYVTQILNVAAAKMKTAANSEKANVFTITDGIRQAYIEVCTQMYGVFRTTGRA